VIEIYPVFRLFHHAVIDTDLIKKYTWHLLSPSHSPMTGLSLLPAGQEEGYGGQTQKFKGVAMIRGPRWAHLPTVTIGLLGVQIFWSVEMSYGVCIPTSFSTFRRPDTCFLASPYLLSLGLSKSSMAGVFVAGPLSGLIMQPLIGKQGIQIFVCNLR